MGRFLIGVLIGMGLSAPWVGAFRIGSPPVINEWNPSTITQLNTYLRAIWELTNGRLTKDVVTTNPNGNRVGTQGDEVYYNNGGSYKLCVNTSATTATSPTGTVWRCSANAFTAP